MLIIKVKSQWSKVKSKQCLVKLLVLLFLSLSLNLFSQGVSVSITGAAADPSAILDISSTSQGFLIPRLSTSQRNGIVLPATSLLIFNTTTNCFEAYVNGSWFSVSCPPPCNPPASPVSSIQLPTSNSIVWNWNTVTGATGYKWGTLNLYSSATDNGANTSYTQIGLACNTLYSLFVWAYNSCGNSSVSALPLTSTSSCGIACGKQIWASVNLNAGTMINSTQGGSQQTNNGIPEKYCYNNLLSNCDIYGGFYEWWEAMNYSSSVNCDPCGPTTGKGGVQGLCPSGYHIPGDLEWSRYEFCIEDSIEPRGNTSLLTFQTTIDLRGSPIHGVGPGDKMKVSGSYIHPWDGTNSSGFTALPTGHRFFVTGTFYYLGTNANFWTSTEIDAANAWHRSLNSGEAQSERNDYNNQKTYGLSIRCLKD
jgi:uncharacterized protein (TIGR02145 family)